jgi:hypothetical protein
VFDPHQAYLLRLAGQRWTANLFLKRIFLEIAPVWRYTNDLFLAGWLKPSAMTESVLKTHY